MSLYVLDTDCLTLLLRGHTEMGRRVVAHDPAELALTIVTVEETLTLAPARRRAGAKRINHFTTHFGGNANAIRNACA
jgi:hypothetical protein